MFVSYRTGTTAGPIYDLAAYAGGGNASSGKGCAAAGWEAVHGPPAYPGVFDFDPAGVGLVLCADRRS